MGLFTDTPLRDLLKDHEISGVDALLRRINGLLSSADHLSPTEKQEVLEGQKALCRIFYTDND